MSERLWYLIYLAKRSPWLLVGDPEWGENWRVWPHCNTQAGCWMHIARGRRWCRCRCWWCRVALRIRPGLDVAAPERGGKEE